MKGISFALVSLTDIGSPPRALNGTGEVQWFLRSNRVDGNRINSAIEELRRTRTTTVRTRKVVLRGFIEEILNTDNCTLADP